MWNKTLHEQSFKELYNGLEQEIKILLTED